MNTNLEKFLEDILLSIDIIEVHVKDIQSISDYEADITISDAVERRLAIIGEAMAKINKIDNTLPIANKPRIVSLRHILVHEYDLIEDATIWNIIFTHLPILKAEAQAILNSMT